MHVKVVLFLAKISCRAKGLAVAAAVSRVTSRDFRTARQPSASNVGWCVTRSGEWRPVRWPAAFASLHLDIRLFQYRLPLRGLSAHEGVEILWRVADRRGAHFFQRGENDRIFQRGGKIGMYPGDELRRHARGSEKAPPHRGVIAGQAGFRDGW